MSSQLFYFIIDFAAVIINWIRMKDALNETKILENDWKMFFFFFFSKSFIQLVFGLKKKIFI